MSLEVFPEIEQRSDEWYEQRRGIVTASVVGQLITPRTVKVANNDTSRAITAQLVAERITGFTDPTYVSEDMWRGVEEEPLARDLYAETYAPVREVGFMVRTLESGHRIGYSPDGLVGEDGLIEIKSRRPKRHLADILAGVVPADAMGQCQAALLVSGRQWCDYVSYCAGMPMWHKRVTPDERWFDAIRQAVAAFEEAAVQMTAAYEQAVEGMPMTERRTDDMELVI